MILTHSLPIDTKVRVRRSLQALSRFPRLGRELEGRWSPFRLILGPWRWMLIVYAYDEREDVVLVLTVQDARSSSAVTSG
jgi:plasmid stabilization system protein ParE